MKFLFVLAAALALVGASAAADTPPAPPQHLVYSILRDGTPIGRDTLDIAMKGGLTSVKRSTDIEVHVLFIPAYSYRYVDSETWRGDQLVAFRSQTDDNGTMRKVALRLNGDQMQLNVDGRRTAVASTVGLDDFWKPELLSKTTVIDTSSGREMTFAAEDLGMDIVPYRGAPHPAHHFKLTGGFDRDLWFDGETPVRFQLKARDGSTIVSQLQ